MRRGRAVGRVKSGWAFVVFAGAERLVTGWFWTSRADDLVSNYKLEINKK